MAIDYESIGKRIKHYRTQKKLSQEELGKAVFATPVHISYIETGARTPSLEILILIANALDSKGQSGTFQFSGWDGDPKPPAGLQ